MKTSTEYYWRIRSSYEDYDSHEPRSKPKSAFCRGCHDQVREWYPRQIEASLPTVARAVLIRVHNPGRVAVIHTALWRQIDRHCPSAIVGPVTMREGDLDKFTLNWVTLTFPQDELVRVRGAGQHAHRVCGICGRQCYAPTGDTYYLLRHQVPDKLIFMDHLSYLIIAEPVASVLDWGGFPDVEYDRLSVLKRPLDGLRLLGDPDWDTMKE